MTSSVQLKPRMIAALVALRTPRMRHELRDAIADVSMTTTLDLLGEMRDLQMVCQKPADDRWHLAPVGAEWLRREGVVL